MRSEDAPAGGRIPLAEPTLAGRERQYLEECVRTGWVSSGGPFVARFEQRVAESAAARHGIAAVNGTAALHLSLLATGIQPDDEVLVPALTFIASANAVSYCGAHPVFVDVSPDTWTLDPEKVSEFLERECEWRPGGLINRASGRRIRALLPVHVLGHPADCDPLIDAARRHDLRVVEDVCEALGASYKNRPVGCLGDVAAFSFNGNKIVTAGGAGVVVTDDDRLAERVRHLSTQARTSPTEYFHDEIGFNYRLTNVCAAVGLAQMEQLPDFLANKDRITARYREAFRDLPGVTCMPSAPWARSSNWLFTIRLGGTAAAGGLVERLHASAVEARRLWCPLHLLPVYRKAQAYRVEVAEAVYADAVSLPSSVGLTAEDQERVIDCVLAFLSP